MVKYLRNDELEFYINILENIKNETIKNSIKKDIRWYCKKSTNSKKLLFLFTFFTISIPAMTPVINSVYKNDIAVNCVAAFNTIISSWLAFRNYKLSWAKYGQTAEEIKREIRLALTMTDKYTEIECEELELKLFRNIEKITAKENENWKNYILKENTNAQSNNILASNTKQ